MTPIPGVHVETVHNPVLYTPRQIEHAAAVAHLLGRGKFVLATRPER